MKRQVRFAKVAGALELDVQVKEGSHSTPPTSQALIQFSDTGNC